jgi:hypothetical protein
MSLEFSPDKAFLLGQSSIEDALKAIKQLGLAEKDFTVIVKDETQWEAGLVPIVGSVQFKHNRSGVERTYRAGDQSTWAFEFIQDLRAGVYD